jgi:hypothetical protein
MPPPQRFVGGHEIVTSMLFRWRIQLGLDKRLRATLAAVKRGSAPSEAMVLNDLLQLPDGMMAIDLADGWCVFAQPAVIQTRCARVDSGEIAS